ncbi:alpha/beta hydrolase [Rhodococcus sp. RS1C4]|uniref:alpha/beta fold hydrolase n=1 Tax=Rhodococcus sp. 114MFTsu3.1 TaxID=1172184 RepID=UPI000376FD28|nr:MULTISPECIES: alpha/beta fold hydrolase [unclassified Rhodococcus (in: high G+C Gram-positive bacteria)]OZC54785.1 alpha/beta hydrolase [Rhodococcus sp. RS1C4]OZC82521.1 alpha/beta hydrolase [Rhodococcus sp. 06-418-1B]OZE83368.1 alpha/beta hydrolase [Rhodococcus sp. 15-649-1-2]
MALPPLVFVPALGCDDRLWQPVADRLAGVLETIVVRGEGNSIRAMADSVLKRSPERFLLAGNSMGGYVALDVAIREQSERVAGLALLNSSAIAADEHRRANSLRVVEMARRGQFEQAVALITSAVAPGRSDIAESAALMALDLGVDVFVEQQIAVMTRDDRRDELSSLDVPTVVIAGSEDSITPSDLGREVADSVPGAEFDLLDGVGHLSTLEAPDAVAGVLRRWIAGIAATSNVSAEVGQ